MKIVMKLEPWELSEVIRCLQGLGPDISEEFPPPTFEEIELEKARIRKEREERKSEVDKKLNSRQ